MMKMEKPMVYPAIETHNKYSLRNIPFISLPQRIVEQKTGSRNILNLKVLSLEHHQSECINRTK